MNRHTAYKKVIKALSDDNFVDQPNKYLAYFISAAVNYSPKAVTQLSLINTHKHAIPYYGVIAILGIEDLAARRSAMRELILRIGNEAPSVFVYAHIKTLQFIKESLSSPQFENLFTTIQPIYTREGKIPAIKKYRLLTNSGLSEAKIWVEKHCKD